MLSLAPVQAYKEKLLIALLTYTPLMRAAALDAHREAGGEAEEPAQQPEVTFQHLVSY